MVLLLGGGKVKGDINCTGKQKPNATISMTLLFIISENRCL